MVVKVKRKWWVVSVYVPWLSDTLLVNGWPWGWGAKRGGVKPYKCSCGETKGHGLQFSGKVVMCPACAEKMCKESFTQCRIKLAPWKEL